MEHKAVLSMGQLDEILGAVEVIFEPDELSPSHPSYPKQERDMILAFREILQISDADYITGFNISQFDLPHILSRIDKLPFSNVAKSKAV